MQAAENEVQNQLLENTVVGTFKQLEDTKNYVETLTVYDIENLPIGTSRTLGNVRYEIAVSGAVQEECGLEITVVARITTPHKELFFGAQGVKLLYDGGFIGEPKLVLLKDESIPFGSNNKLILHGGFDKTTGAGIEKTYLTMDCNGFKELSIDADFVFSESLIRKVDAAGNPDGQVSCHVQTIVGDWSDILVSVDVPRFAAVGLDGFIFEVKNAVFDFSDKRNDPEMRFPDDYASTYLIPGLPQLWKGVSIGKFEISLPKQFAYKNSDKRISFSARNMLIDNNGVSGLFTAKNILPADEGSAGGWRFSVEDFSLEMVAGHITGAGFSGIIGLPVSELSELPYSAFISPNNEYMLTVSPAKDIPFDILTARAEIFKSSQITLRVKDGKFLPEARLDGKLDIMAKLNSQSTSTVANISDIRFTGMRLQTVEPYFSIDRLGCEGEVSLKGFPLSISKIQMTSAGGEAKLGFDAKLSLAGDKTPITAGTRLEIVCTTGSSNWKFKKLDISKIAIDASIAEAFSLKGELALLNGDPVYGDGFAGAIDLKITKGIDAGIKVNAIFGKKDFRYWHVDGLAEFSSGIPVFPPAVKLTGFGGGASYKMKHGGDGSSPTGIKYVPDANSGLSLKAAVLLTIAKKGLVDGEASFEITFNQNGGLSYIGFHGQAKFMGTIPGADSSKDFVASKFRETGKSEDGKYPATEKLGESGFAAAMDIDYDFKNRSLHATFDLYVNAANGMLKGVSSGNRAGWAVFHSEPGKWYIYMGTPKERIGIKISLADAFSVETGSYFMIGNTLPDESPEVPQKVLDILKLKASDVSFFNGTTSAMSNGGGVAFGSSLTVSTGDITFLIVYASFNAGLGFDIMLKDYGSAQCKGRNGNIGIDGWYATGQAYAYLQGEVGVKINLLFIKKKIPIIKGAAAALLQAGLPNPAWFTGYLGVEFNLLGGLVRGNVRLKLSIGEKCEIVQPGGSPLEAMMIGDITPSDRSNDVDVFAAPQVAFNMPVGKEFEMEEDGGTKRYRLTLEEFSVSDNGKVLTGKHVWNENKDAVSFYSHEILPSQKPLKTKVRIRFEELTNGKWMTVSTGGQIAEEKKETEFTTGTAPDVIPLHNIEYCYPVINQRYFYPKESAKAYVQLKRGQSYLFTTDMSHKIRIIRESAGVQEQDFKNYNSELNRIEYSMPSIALNGKYEFDLASYPKESKDTGADTQRRTSVGDGGADGDVTVRDAKAGEAIQNEAGKSLLKYKFSTSAYNTFAEKTGAIEKGEAFAVKLASDAINLQYEIKKGEPFDVTELLGTEFSGGIPLLSATATLDDYYFTDIINPLIYSDYPPAGIKLQREAAPYGIPPAKALPFNIDYITQIENGNYSGAAQKYFPYIYNLTPVYREDYHDLRNRIINRWQTDPPKGLERFYTGSFPFIVYGYYNITLQYILPGAKQGAKQTFK
ncbi:MAG: hypothetical protein LBG92_05930, partial [Prevotellaceae bacterium]|nr:hypothetical protein [Prevotellaceae bacterium]